MALSYYIVIPIKGIGWPPLPSVSLRFDSHNVWLFIFRNGSSKMTCVRDSKELAYTEVRQILIHITLKGNLMQY